MDFNLFSVVLMFLGGGTAVLVGMLYLVFALGVAIRVGVSSPQFLVMVASFYLLVSANLLSQQHVGWLVVFTFVFFGLLVLGLLSDPNRVLIVRNEQLKAGPVADFVFSRGWERILQRTIMAVFWFNPFLLLILAVIKILPLLSSDFKRLQVHWDLVREVDSLIDQGVSLRDISKRLHARGFEYTAKQVLLGEYPEIRVAQREASGKGILVALVVFPLYLIFVLVVAGMLLSQMPTP